MAYTQALAYILTKDKTYAENVMNIMDAWARTVHQFVYKHLYLFMFKKIEFKIIISYYL